MAVSAIDIQSCLIERELARRTMEYFVPYVMPNYLMGDVHRLLCLTLDNVLKDIELKLSPRLIITMPPRHGKSTLASQKLPAFAFGRYPNMEIIASSYSTDLAGKMSREVQKTLSEPRYKALFPHIELSRSGHNIQTIEEFTIPGYNGSYKAAGVGSGITGRGADLLIIDDPLKDMKEADSLTIRESVWDWFYSTAYTRLSAGAGVVVIQTRWHTDDLAGRLLQPSEHGDVYQLLNFPAIAEDTEYFPDGSLFRNTGDPLHAERIPLKTLLNIKATSPDRIWAALFQQRPVLKGGNIFKEEWFRFYEPQTLPKLMDRIVISCDMTFKDTDGTDFVVFQAWGQKGADFFLIDQVRDRMSFAVTCKKLLLFIQKHPKAVAKLIEDKANGPAIINTLQRKVYGLKPVEPLGSKTARAEAISPIFESGNVYLPNAAWVRDYINEMLNFPYGAHDDQVDCTAQGLGYLVHGSLFNWASGTLI